MRDLPGVGNAVHDESQLIEPIEANAWSASSPATAAPSATAAPEETPWWDTFADIPSLIRDYWRLLAELIERLTRSSQLPVAIERVWSTLSSGHDVYVVGNGGSATTAEHLACDMALALGACAPGSLRCGSVYALGSHPALVTALGNDVAFEDVFSRQLAARGRPGDLLVAFSVSGRSPNIVRACEAAARQRMGAVALLGQAGHVVDLVEVAVVVGQRSYGRVEDLHLSISHLMTTVVLQRHREKHAAARSRILTDYSAGER